MAATSGRPRLIATEEAYMIPQQRDAILRLLDKGGTEPDLEMWEQILRSRGPYLRDRLLDIEDERLAEMDRHGVDMHVLSLTSPGVQMFEPDEATAIARSVNDHLAEVIARHPTRFAGLATIAPQDPAAAAREIDRAINELGLNGIVINSHTAGHYLDEDRFFPILEAAETCDAPIYIHPRMPPSNMIEPFRPYTLETAIWGFNCDTGLHAIRMICGQVFDRFPRLKVVLGHMGEGLPFFLWRLDYMHGSGASRPSLEMKPSDYLKRNFWITTSGMAWDPVLRFSAEVLGPDRILFAIDHPYQKTEPAVEAFRSSALPADQLAMIASGNAESLFHIAPAGDA